MTPVTLRFSNDAIPPQRIPGVVATVYQTSGAYVTEGITNSDGEVFFSLPDDSYDLMFFKIGLSMVQPQRIVVDVTMTNVFLLRGHERTIPESSDPSLCRVSGWCLDAFGHPARYGMLSFQPADDILVNAGIAVVPGSLARVKAPPDGFYEFDLIRNAKYKGYFEQIQQIMGNLNTELAIQVPDLPAIDLTTLLFPIPLDVTLTQAGVPISAITVPMGPVSDDSVLVNVGYSDGSVRQSPPLWGGVLVVNDTPAVVEPCLAVNKLVLKPLAPGTAHITFGRSINPGATFLPAPPPFTSDTLTVTVV